VEFNELDQLVIGFGVGFDPEDPPVFPVLEIQDVVGRLLGDK